MHRFYCPTLASHTADVCLTDKEEIHHIKNVLRFKQGNSLHIFNGKGLEAQGTIVSLKSDQIKIHIDQFMSQEDKTKPLTLILACAIPKKSKFETIIEKSTELGVDIIIPLKTQRTEVDLSIERATKKIERYENVALNAAKQCRRSTLPTIYPLTNFSEALKLIDQNTAAFLPCLSMRNRIPLRHALEKVENRKKIIFFIGPEGDFTPEEIERATQAGCIPISLGPTVLKVETAAIAVLSFAQFYFDHS